MWLPRAGPNQTLVSAVAFDGYMSIVANRTARLVTRSVLALAVFCACAGPARTNTSYRLKARNSAKAALSAIETSGMAATLVRDRGAFWTYVGVVLDSAERDVTSVEATFSSIQPPDGQSDQLREQLDQVLNDAGGTVSSMRIAARRDDRDALLQASEDLPRLSDELQKYADLPA